MRYVLGCRVGIVAVIVAGAGLLGCGQSAPQTVDHPAAADAAGVGRSAAVVADVSSGTNPYHRDFRRPDWTEHPCRVIPGLPCSMPALPLTLGDDYAANLAADRAAWDAYERNVVYWVPGTNLLLLTLVSWEDVNFDGDAIRDGYVGAEYISIHGLATSSVVSRSCPECYVLVVQDALSGERGDPLRTLARDYAWVDIVTQTSFPLYGNDPYEYVVQEFADASRELAESGRLYFAGSGNTAIAGFSTLPIYTYDLPPWVVLVGGAQSFNFYRLANQGVDEPCNATVLNAGRPAEFVGDYTQQVGMVESVDEITYESGTSFATPQAAARVARALVRVRQSLGDKRAPGLLWSGPAPPGSTALADGQLDATELRQAFMATAEYFTPEDFVIQCEVDYLTHTNPMAPQIVAPVSPAAWLDMGWGFISDLSSTAAADLLLGQAAATPKPDAAMRYMDAFMTLRAAAFSCEDEALCDPLPGGL